MKWTFQFPRKSEILIYDEAGSEYIKPCLPDKKTPYIQKIRLGINLHPAVLIQFCFLWIRREIIRDQEPLTVRGLFQLAEIRCVKPNVVITFGENNHNFGMLSQRCPDATFLGIQNGFRGPRVSDIKGNLRLKNALCFGQETIDKYKASGQSIVNYERVGSLVNGLYEEIRPIYDSKTYDLCLISQYRPARFDKTMPELKTITLQLLGLLQEYCAAYKKTLCIAMSCKEDNRESEFTFFSRYISLPKVEMIPNNESEFSTYHAIDQSVISLHNYSTAGLEGLSRGNKILFVNTTDNDYYNVPGEFGEGIWALSDGNLSFERFSERLKIIEQMSNEQWRLETAEFSQYFIFRDEKVLPQDKIKRRIRRALLEV